ncbi:RNA dependent RNA polymerase-domain-containing protein [Cunninghamella echinulata]|nr:RNA dependent RNA polymerase-domain-containing protein [Cunninghamella echinulata]
MPFHSNSNNNNEERINEYISHLSNTPSNTEDDNNINETTHDQVNYNFESRKVHNELISNTLIVTNLNSRITKKQVEIFFSKYGIIRSIDLDPKTNIATITFAIEPFSAEFTKGNLELDGHLVEARFIIPEREEGASPINQEQQEKKITTNAEALSLGLFSKSAQFTRYWKTPIKVNLTMDTSTNCYEIKFHYHGIKYKIGFSHTMLTMGMKFEVIGPQYATLTFALKHPPIIWEKDTMKHRHHHHKQKTVWKRLLVLERGGIYYESDDVNQQPIGVEPNFFIVNFHQWNVFCVEFTERDILSPNFTSFFKKTSELGILYFSTDYSKLTSLDFVTTKGSTTYFYDPEQRTATIRDHKLLYLLECAISNHCFNPYILGRSFYKILNDLEPSIACQLLECIIAENKIEYDPDLALQIAWDKIKSTVEYGMMPIMDDDHFTTIYSVYITPTSLIVQPPRIEESNRLLRKYKHHMNRFLKVQFVEEDLGPLPSSFLRCGPPPSLDESYNEQSILDRIYKVLTNGIQLGKLTYQFLAYDTTLLKHHACWFFASFPTLTIDDILNSMGKMDLVTSLSQYTSAMDICLHPTEKIKIDWQLNGGNNKNNNNVSTKKLKHNNKKNQNQNNYCNNQTPKCIEWIDYSYNNDGSIRPGCGKMSSQFARELTKLSYKADAINGTPSAIQFTLGGTLGVLALSNFISGKVKIQLRPCQYVFNKPPSDLEIIQFSTYKPAFLDRSIITILMSLGIHEDVFRFMVQHSIQKLDTLNDYPSITYDYLKEFANEFGTVQRMRYMIQAGFLTRLDPFIYNSICAFKFHRLKSMRKIGSLHIKRGAELMVILDDTGTLAPNEIFCQISDLNEGFLSKREIVKGPCMIFPKPCLHSGDIKIVQAVNSPKLRHWNDVIVVSSKQPSSLPSQIVGGQFNGQRFTIIWDPQLIPFRPLSNTLENKESPNTTSDKPFSRSMAMKYFVHYVLNDHRECIEKYFLRAADKSSRNAQDGECTQLSVQYADVMEFIQAPCAITLEDKSNDLTFPDFLEVPNYTSYESDKILGRIYRMIQPITYIDYMKKMITEFTDTTVVYDPRLKKDGMEKYIIDAREIKKIYEYALKKLMEQYGIQTEAEIITGYVYNNPVLDESYHYNHLQQEMMASVYALRLKYRHIFELEFSSNNTPTSATASISANERMEIKIQKESKAAAWYYVTYHPSERAIHQSNFLSFPWVLDDYLCTIAKEQPNATDSSPLDKIVIEQYNKTILDGNKYSEVHDIIKLISDANDNKFEITDEEKEERKNGKVNDKNDMLNITHGHNEEYCLQQYEEILHQEDESGETIPIVNIKLSDLIIS